MVVIWNRMYEQINSVAKYLVLVTNQNYFNPSLRGLPSILSQASNI